MNESGEIKTFNLSSLYRYLIPSVTVLLLAINYCRSHAIDENMGQGLTTSVQRHRQKFIAGNSDTGNDLSQLSNTKLRVSLRIFKKVKIPPNGTLRGPEETES